MKFNRCPGDPEDSYPPAARKVFAVVVTHNGTEWIEECLQSLVNGCHPFTTIVVDNGSMDSTLTLVGTFPDVICLPQDRNLGFGRANNIGIHEALEAGAEYVFLLALHTEQLSRPRVWD